LRYYVSSFLEEGGVPTGFVILIEKKFGG